MKANYKHEQPIDKSPFSPYSPLYRELSIYKSELPLFFVLKDTISAKDAMKTIEIFDFDKNYLNKKIVFLQNTSGGHWEVVVKNEGDYRLNTIDVYGDGLCGLTSAILAMKELNIAPPSNSFDAIEGALSRNQYNQYTISQRDQPEKYKTFTNDDGLKLKIGRLLRDARLNNWLESFEIEEIIVTNNRNNAFRFDCSLDSFFENNKKHEFHVRTLFCNYLSENLPKEKSLATLDLNNLILTDFDTGVNKLKFKEGDKFDFKYLFPVDERDLNKVKIFYRDMEGGEKMISKVVKILDKYFKDLEKEEDTEKINIKTFLIVEKAIDQIIATKNKFGEDCQFPKEDYEKIVKFRGDRISNPAIEQKTNEQNTKLVRPYRDPPTPKDDEWTLFKPFEDFFQNLLDNSSEKKVNSGQQNERTSERKSPNFTLHTEGKHGSKDEPSNFLQEIIDVICCVNPNRKNR